MECSRMLYNSRPLRIWNTEDNYCRKFGNSILYIYEYNTLLIHKLYSYNRNYQWQLGTKLDRAYVTSYNYGTAYY